MNAMSGIEATVLPLASYDPQTYAKVVRFAEEVKPDVPPAHITPLVRIDHDLGMDSTDQLDFFHFIEKEFKINLSMDQWANDEDAPLETYFRLDLLCNNIDRLVKDKG